MRTVYVVISCDVDPDRERLLEGVGPDRLYWRGVTEGIPALKQSVRGLQDSAGREPVFTWFIRADEQIREMQGSYAWFPRAHEGLLREVAITGDELGWHPHFWRRDPETGRWYQELDDRDWQLAMLRAAHAELAAALPDGVRSVRMGWSYHNDATIAALQELGVTVDLSALPGFATLGANAPRRGENLYDWCITPRTPYQPSRADYRRPPGAGEVALQLLEVPSYVSSSRLWSLMSGLQMARKTGSAAPLWRSLERPSYSINVTARPVYFAPLVHDLRKRLRRDGDTPVVFETHFHPDELVPNRSALYELHGVRANIESLIRACERAGARLEFVQARRIPEVWAQ